MHNRYQLALSTSALILAISFCTSAVAQQNESPARFPVLAGFVPTHDGAYRVVILSFDSVGANPTQKYCGPGWSYGMIQMLDRSTLHNNALTTNPSGCWAASGSDINSSQITFRIFSLTAGSVQEFKIDPKLLKKYLYEWRSERLLPFK